jgi:hypothetical protein
MGIRAAPAELPQRIFKKIIAPAQKSQKSAAAAQIR